MSQVELTPELLAEIKRRAESVLDYKASGSPSYNQLVMIEMAFHEKANPATVLAMAEMLTRLRENKPTCLHWWNAEHGEWQNCKDGNGRDEHSEPHGYCPDCGGEVEIIEDPYKKGGAE